MIESKNEASRNLEKALQALEQAKKRRSRTRKSGKRRTTTSTSWAVLS